MIEIRKTDVYVQWLDGLRDIHARARILARVERLAAGNRYGIGLPGNNVHQLFGRSSKS